MQDCCLGSKEKPFRLRAEVSCRKLKVFIPLHKVVAMPHSEWKLFAKMDTACLRMSSSEPLE